MKRLRRMRTLIQAAVFAVIAALAIPLSAPLAFAQATTGSVRGIITDQSGAVVPNASITAKNQATGVQSSVYQSTNVGIYNIPNLTPGTYTITVEAQNFKKAVFTDVEVRVGTDVTIDAALQPGGMTETVTVTSGGEELVNKETAQVSTSFDARKVSNLPSNVAGAGLDTLALLAPGVVPGFGNVNSNGTTLSVNGQRARSNNFTIDGQDNNDLSIGGPSYFVSNQDAVQDFQVITNNFSAQYGRNQGAIVNLVLKSGTNSFHGSAFEFHRDRKNFDSLNNIERRSGQKDPNPLLYNVYGGTFGGRIIKDKAFFFGSYQGIKTRESFTARSGSLAILPSEFDRLKATFPGNGAIAALADFGAFALSDFGTLTPRTDLGPSTGTLTVNGRTFITGGAYDVVILPLNPTLPATGTNAVGFQAARPERTFKTALATPYTQDEGTGRVDYRISDKDSIWGRFLYQTNNFKDGLGGSNGFTGDIPAVSKNLGVNYTRQLSSRSVNEGRFAFSRLFVKFGGGCGSLKGCIPDPAKIDEAFANITFASVRGATTGSSVQTIGPATNLPQGRTVDSYQFTDNYSITMGKHQLAMGADIRRLVNSVPFLPNVNGAIAVSTASRLVFNSPASVTVAAGQATLSYKELDQFYFFQDDFKILDNLTLNLGVRYEYIGQPINLLHDLTVKRESDPTTALFKTSLPLEARTVPKIPADKNNIAPRIGFAWTPRSSSGWMKKMLGEDATVIRGGYSVAYDPPFYNILLNISTNAPVVFNSITLNPSSPTAANPVLFPVPSAPAFGPAVRQLAADRGLIIKGVLDPRFQNQVPVAGDFHLPYAENYSIGIQRQINRNNVVEIRYVGTHGVGLFQTNNRNPRIDRLINGFSATVPGLGTVAFPKFPNLVPTGLTPQVAGSGSCVDDPATPFINETAACNGRVLPRGRILARENTAQSTYNGLQTRYNGRLFNQLTLGGAYSFSKALDNSSEIFAFGVFNASSQNPFNIGNAEKSYSGFDRRHAGSINAIWDLPFYKDQKGVLGRVLGGWQINYTHVITSGRRFTPQEFSNNTFAAGLGIGYEDPLTGGTSRPFYGNPKAPKDTVGITSIDAALLGYIASASSASTILSLNDLNNGKTTVVTKDQVRYILNGPGANLLFNSPYGDVPRFIEQAPTLNQANGGLFKNIKIKEQVTLQFRAEAFNLFNHPTPGYGSVISSETSSFPDTLIEDAGLSGSRFNVFQDMTFARRIIQLGVRLTF